MPAPVTILSRLSLGLFFEIIYAPVWWYTQGLLWIINQIGTSIKDTANSASLGLWVRNLFVPMYGQYDVWGRIVSFMIRFANIVGRSLWVGLWVIMCAGVLLVWLILPPALFFIFLSSLIRRAYV